MATRINNPKVQRFNKASPYAPLDSGQLFFYETGTTTLKTTYSDEAQTTANTNPVILDAAGFEPDIWGAGNYRIVLKSSVASNSLTQWDVDPVNFASEEGVYSDWVSTTDYGAGGTNIVTGSDDNFYISIQTPNLNKDPTSNAEYWTEFDLLKQWNTNETYDIGDPITYSSRSYIGLTASNAGNQPDTNPTNWELQNNKITVQKFTVSGTWTKPAGVNYIVVEVVGGGAGGAGQDTTSSESGGGGGAGGYARIVLSASALTSETVTIGAGGAGGASGANTGIAGGQTSLGTLCVATGGLAGQIGGSANGALGGIGTTGDILASGGFADAGHTLGGTKGSGGGSSAMGSGGEHTVVSADGAVGRNFGGGGAGGYNSASGSSNRAGGAGAAGFVIVTEYY